MFKFLKGFDCLAGDEVTLKLTEKNKGDKNILPFYYYNIYNKQDAFVGKISIRIGNNFHSYYNGHIGYEIFEKYRGNHYSFHAATLVLNVAKAHNMHELYLTCKQTNIASIKIIERLGAYKKEVAKIPKRCFFYEDGIDNYCIYILQLGNTTT